MRRNKAGEKSGQIRRGQPVHLSRIPLSGRAGATDELSFASIHAVNAGVRAGWQKKCDAGLRACRARALPVLFIWRLHVRGVDG